MIRKCQIPLHGPDRIGPDQTKSADFVGDPGPRQSLVGPVWLVELGYNHTAICADIAHLWPVRTCAIYMPSIIIIIIIIIIA